MSDLYRDFIDQKADQIINSLGGTITPAPPNELYRDFLDRKFDDVINACNGLVKVKSFTYTGTGSYSNNTIVFPEKPKLILHIWGINIATGYEYVTGHIFTPDDYAINVDQLRNNGMGGNLAFITKIDDYTIKLSNITGQPTWNLNTLDDTYTVYYI